MSEPVRVLISYSHQPEAYREHVLKLANRLRQDGVDAWIDRYSPTPPEGWPRWMTREFERARYIVVVCTHAYRQRFNSEVGPSGVLWEAGLIREELYRRGGNHRFVPILLEDDESAVPTELAAYMRYRYPSQYEAILRHLTGQPEVVPPSIGPRLELPPLPVAAPLSEGTRSEAGGRLWNVPSRPEQFLGRAELEILKSILIRGGSQPLAVSGQHKGLGIQGMPGVGKTVLAVALATDAAVQRAFPGGIFWLTIGRMPEDPVLWQEQLAAAAGAREARFRTSGQGKASLQARFAELPPALLILDDVWNIDHADPFNVVAGHSKLLITTRNKEVAHGMGAKIKEITELTAADALILLANYAERPVDDLPEAAASIVRECGELPLALAMAGSMLRGRRDDRWDGLLDELRRANLDHLARALPDYRQYRSMLAALKASVDELSEDVRSRFFDVAVSARYGAVPESVLHQLWKGEPGWSRSKTQRIVDALEDRAIIQRAAREQITVHNLQHDYVRAVGGDLRPRHQRLVRAYLDDGTTKALHAIQDDGYFFEHIAKHVREGEGAPALRRLLFDAQWLAAKLRATEPNALLSDFDLLDVDQDESLSLLRDALRLSAHVVGPRPAELPSQLLGRLHGLPHTELRALCAQLEETARAPVLLPAWPTLTPPGGSLLFTLEGHQGLVQAVALSADSKLVLSGSEDRTLKVWSLATGKALRTLEGHQGQVNAVALSQDAKIAVSGAADSTLRVWDVVTGKELRVLRGHQYPVYSVALSADGKIAVSGAGDWTVKVWDVSSGELVRTYEGHQGAVRAVALGRDGRTIVSGSKDKTVRIWDLPSGKELRTLEGHEGWVLSVAMSDDAEKVLSGSDDKTARVWDIAGDRAPRILGGHDDWVLSVALSPDGRIATTGSSDRTLRIWDVASEQPLRVVRKLENWVCGLALSRDSKTLVSASNDIKVWRVMGEEARIRHEHTVPITSVAISAAGEAAVVASEEAARVFDIASGATVRVLDGHQRWLRAVVVSRDGAIAVSGADDHTLRIWDIASGRSLQTLAGHQGSVQAVAMSGDGRTIVSGSTDRTLKMWEVGTGEMRWTSEAHSGWVNAVALSSDGRTVLSGSTDPSVLVWNGASGSLVRTLQGHRGSVLSIAISHDGRTAVSGATDHDVRVWDLASGQVVRTLEGHTSWVQTVALTVDGNVAISGSLDKTIRVWDLRSGKSLATFTAESAVTSVALDSFGRLLAGDAAGRLHLLKPWKAH